MSNLSAPKQALKEIEEAFFNFTTRSSKGLEELFKQTQKLLAECYQANAKNKLQDNLRLLHNQGGTPSSQARNYLDRANDKFIQQNKQDKQTPTAQKLNQEPGQEQSSRFRMGKK